jgi:serine/threonine protein kinase
MAKSHELQSLYQHFDRLIDLPLGEQQLELDALRALGDPLALQLEGMLICHRYQNPTDLLFSVEDLVDSVKTELPWKLAADLRELSHRLHWDTQFNSFRLGHFSLFQCLSVSAIGATYQAHDQDLDRDVVLLLLFPRWSSMPEIQRRTLEASKTVAKIFDPHVATILGTLNLEGIFAVVRQWIPGKNLDQWVASGQAVTLQSICMIGRGLANGLETLHKNEVLHGDLKPANIILRQESWHPVITDFGTATWISPKESTSWHGGTKGFVAPEILCHDNPTPQSDIYSLGVILQWLATGIIDRLADENDWSQASVRLVGEKATADDFDRFELFKKLTSSMLETNVTLRPRSAGWIAAKLAECIDQETSLAPVVETIKVSRSSRLEDNDRSRRQWLRHVFGLGLTASVSTWAGGRLRATKSEVEEPFVPGTHFSEEQHLRVKNGLDTELMQSLPALKTYNGSVLKSNPAIKLVQPNRWGWLEFEPVMLSAIPYKVAVIQLILYFDLDPRMASYRVEGQFDKVRSWSLLSEGRNEFGGSYSHFIETRLGKEVLSTSRSIQLRFGMMYKRAASYQSEYPPVALQLYSVELPYDAGKVAFWY